jgi:DNA-binding cell septation regulator SpoVG
VKNIDAHEAEELAYALLDAVSSLDNQEKVQIIKLDDGVRVVYLTLPSDDMPNREYTIFKTPDSKPLLKVVE